MEEKQNKKKNLSVVIAIILIILVTTIICLIIVNNKEKYKQENTENIKIIYFYKENGEYKYTNELEKITNRQVISKYQCKNDCQVLGDTPLGSFNILSTKKAFIYTNKQLILYDIDDKKEIGKYGDDISWLTLNDEDEYIYIKSSETEKYGIIDKNGNLIHDFDFNDSFSVRFIDNSANNNKVDSIRLMDKKSVYSIKDNMIIASKDDKYGIVEIKSNKVIIDYQYDEIGLINSKYYMAKNNDKWYIYSFDTKEKHIEEGFNKIYNYIDNTLMVETDGKIYFRDYNNKNLTEDTIEIKECQKEYDTCTRYFVAHEEEDNIYRIVGYKDMSNGQQVVYLYNTANHTLEK